MSTKRTPQDYQEMLAGIGGLALIVLLIILFGIWTGHTGTPAGMGQ